MPITAPAPAAPLPPQVAGVQAEAPAAGLPVFSIGGDFADLQQALGTLIGNPLEDEHAVAGSAGCDDQQQRTSTGLAYLECAVGTPSFVADPDGLYHWALLGDRVAAWIGPQVDAPDMALDRPVCVGPAVDPVTACPLRLNVPVAGFLRDQGQSDAYRFSVSNSPTDVVVDLTELPADYDLYLVDDSGAVRAQSTQEGTSPEHLEQTLPTGNYYLYVHVDAGRDPDPTQAYTLRLSQAPQAASEPTTNDAPIG
ncbi:MAG: pre-peptidase C-terminal domain-containing protein [Chloroflexota bacterium]